MNGPSMNSLDAQILTSEHALFDGEVTGVRMPGGDGSFEVRPLHAPIISTLKPGLILVRTTAGEELKFAVSGGVVEFYDNVLSVLAEAAERVEEIDLERAEKAQERAENRLQKADHDNSIDQKRAEKARVRAKNRIELHNRFA
jgi:F-type H+-transporting ATPase subunit epsilon